MTEFLRGYLTCGGLMTLILAIVAAKLRRDKKAVHRFRQGQLVGKVNVLLRKRFDGYPCPICGEEASYHRKMVHGFVAWQHFDCYKCGYEFHVDEDGEIEEKYPGFYVDELQKKLSLLEGSE